MEGPRTPKRLVKVFIPGTPATSSTPTCVTPMTPEENPMSMPLLPMTTDLQDDIPDPHVHDTSTGSSYSWRNTVINYVTTSQYHKAMALLKDSSTSAREAILAVTKKAIQQEVTKACRKRAPKQRHILSMSKETCGKNLEDLHWADIVSECEQEMPLTSQSMIRKGTRSSNKKGTLTDHECESALNCRFTILLSLCLHSHAPWRYKFLQQTMGVEMWPQGCSKKIFRILNYIGLSSSKNTARGVVDRIIVDHDREVLEAKKRIEEIPQQTPSHLQNTQRRRLTFSGCGDRCGFSIGWDNVQKELRRKHSSSETGNHFIMMAMSYAVNHRIPSLQLINPATVTAVSIDPAVVLPSQSDWETLEDRKCLIIQRILTKYIAGLKPLGKKVCRTSSLER